MNLTPTQVRDRLLKILDQVIADGQWDSSLFFKNILKQIQQLRENVALELTEKGQALPSDMAMLQPLAQQREGYEKAYVSLYQTESRNIDRWLHTIKMLTNYSVNRPSYRNESDIEETIRIRGSSSEAYVVAWVKQTDIIPAYSGVPLRDRHGHELLTLKEGWFKLEHVLEFVHEGKRYRLHGERLVLRE